MTQKVMYFVRHDNWTSKVYLTDCSEPREVLPTYNGGSLRGQLGHCGRLFHLVAGSSEDLGNKEPPRPLREVTVEVWERRDEEGRNLLHTQDIVFRGIRWGEPTHTGDCSCCCGGSVTFEFEEKEVVQRGDEECLIPESEKYLSLCAAKNLDEYRSDVSVGV